MHATLRESLTQSISEAVDILCQNQFPSGGFPNYMSSDREMEKDCRFDHCVFSSTVIGYCLTFSKDEKAIQTLQKIREFLTREMIYPGIWCYWSTDSSLRIIPDMDDTCCASFLLRKSHPYLLRGESITLLLRNRSEGGLFYTWLNPSPDFEEQKDIDSVVNANVVLYLGEREETRKTISFLNRIVLEDREEGTYWYYLDNLALYYMMSRAYFNGVRSLHQSADSIVGKVTSMQYQNGSFGDELSTALAMSTLMNYDFNDSAILSKGIEFLLDTQGETGLWKKRAFYAGPRHPCPHSVWYGAEALTTALCLEALLRFEGIVAAHESEQWRS
jgi:hypothetical protein